MPNGRAKFVTCLVAGFAGVYLAAAVSPLCAQALTPAPGEKADSSDAGPSLAAMAEEARRFVERESPVSAFPFDTGRTGQGKTLVIAHYLPVFPLSIDNNPPNKDYYAAQYLVAAGEAGKHARQRGFIRERPLVALPRRPLRWKQADLAVQIARASRIGIDAFGIDLLALGHDDLFETAAFGMLDAAHSVDGDFRIIPELDFGGLADKTADDIADFLVRFGRRPAAYRLDDGRLLVIPLWAESRPAGFWREVMAKTAAHGMPIALVPDFLETSKIDDLLPLAWGATVWGTRTPDAAGEYARWPSSLASRGVRRWISPVSAQDYRPKDGLIAEAVNSVSFRSQWTEAISSGNRMVHLLTWNDYSEATQLGPSSFSQFAWYDLNAYYIAWLKRGSPPPLRSDALYYIHRWQVVKLEDIRRGPPQKMWGGYPLHNEVELVALLTEPGTLSIRMGTQVISREVGAGLQTLRAPALPGRPVFTLSRHGRTVLSEASDWLIEANPARHDATYGGGSTTRHPAADPQE